MASGESGSEELRVSSEFRNGQAVRAFVRRIAERCEMGNDAVADLMLAVSEVFNNAVEHAHHLDAGREILVRVRPREDALEVDICDQGPGFDPAEARPPASISPTQRGLGLFLARQMVDHIEFTHGSGTTVRLVKAIRA